MIVIWTPEGVQYSSHLYSIVIFTSQSSCVTGHAQKILFLRRTQWGLPHYVVPMPCNWVWFNIYVSVQTFACTQLLHVLVELFWCPDARDKFDGLCLCGWFGDVDVGPGLHPASASWILHARVYLWWVKAKDVGRLCSPENMNGTSNPGICLWTAAYGLIQNKLNGSDCFPGAALGRLLGEGVASSGLTSGQQWSSINPGGYALAGAKSNHWHLVHCQYIYNIHILPNVFALTQHSYENL